MSRLPHRNGAAKPPGALQKAVGLQTPTFSQTFPSIRQRNLRVRPRSQLRPQRRRRLRVRDDDLLDEPFHRGDVAVGTRSATVSPVSEPAWRRRRRRSRRDCGLRSGSRRAPTSEPAGAWTCPRRGCALVRRGRAHARARRDRRRGGRDLGSRALCLSRNCATPSSGQRSKRTAFVLLSKLASGRHLRIRFPPDIKSSCCEPKLNAGEMTSNQGKVYVKRPDERGRHALANG